MVALTALGGGVLISFAGIFFVLSEASPFTGAFYRAAYALPVLVVLFWLGRKRDRRPSRARWLAVAAGLFLGADLVSWNASIDQIGAGLATLIVNTSVIFVALGAWLAFGEKPSKTTAYAIPIILFGIALVSGVGQSNAFGESPLLGTALALLGALFYAGFILGFRHSNKERAPAAGPLMEATVGVMIFTTAVSIPIGSIDYEITWPGHAWLIAMAFGAQVLGWLLIGYALPRLPAAETATIILLQPAMTMTWGAIFLGERPSALQITGAAIVLGGVTVVALRRARREMANRPQTALATQHHDQ